MGLVAVPVDVGDATLITCAGTAPCLDEPERPIKTPTPIASSSTPTPAITVSVLLR